MKPKRGRPPKAAGDRRDVRMEVRGTPEQVEAITAAAAAAGVERSVYVCEAAFARARRDAKRRARQT